MSRNESNEALGTLSCELSKIYNIIIIRSVKPESIYSMPVPGTTMKKLANEMLGPTSMTGGPQL